MFLNILAFCLLGLAFRIIHQLPLFSFEWFLMLIPGVLCLGFYDWTVIRKYKLENKIK